MKTVLDALNAALHQAFADDERVYLLGEDLLDPYGGAFKVSRGLSTAYPQRVLSSPISEAGITGLAGGMALRGLRPVVEIMFGDFLTLTADQLINHLAKFRWMYNEQTRAPVVLRTPMGGRRGYGPTHSQTLEKLFLGVPGLQVVAPSPFNLAAAGLLPDPGQMLRSAILETQDPLLFVENKLLYLLPLLGPASLADFQLAYAPSLPGDSFAPAYRLTVAGAPPASLTLAAYGYMAELARQAALRLAYEHEVFCEVISPSRLAPFDDAAVLASLAQTGRVLAVEEGTLSLGWGAELLARAAQALGPGLRQARRLAAAPTPIPASGPLEQAALPGVEAIVAAALAMAA